MPEPLYSFNEIRQAWTQDIYKNMIFFILYIYGSFLTQPNFHLLNVYFNKLW